MLSRATPEFDRAVSLILQMIDTGTHIVVIIPGAVRRVTCIVRMNRNSCLWGMLVVIPANCKARVSSLKFFGQQNWAVPGLIEVLRGES